MPARVNGAAYPRYTLITHVRLIDPVARRSEDCDLLLVRDSAGAPPTVAAIGIGLKPPADAPITRVRGTGLYACRSFVDLHLQVCEPGAMYKEDLRTATAAAASGGYGDALAIPSPAVIWHEEETLDYIRSNADAVGRIPLQVAAHLTESGKGQRLSDLALLLSHHAAAFYDSGVASPALLYSAMEQLARTDTLLILRASIPALCSRTAPHKASATSEAAAVASALTMAEATGCRLHLTLISTALSVELIRTAKARGVKVTADTAPQYFTLTRADLLYYGNLAKVEPPLRSPSDRTAIIEALADGTIDCIVSDHTPETATDKRKSAADAPAGMIGLQTAFALGMRELVLTGKLDLYRLIELLSQNPARILGLPDTIAVGGPAKVTLIDLEHEYVLTEGMLDSKSKNCPWVGQSFQGIVKRNFSKLNEK
ncbi:MAG: amidohydrolase family protein [Clostridia bacterium]|nr:amidohydrolase family protein [Clostridia bacterium]